MNATEIRDFFYENYYKRIGFSKEEIRYYRTTKSLTLIIQDYKKG